MTEQFPLDRQLVYEVEDAGQKGNKDVARQIALAINDEALRLQALLLIEATLPVEA